jgi:TIR domain
MMPLVELKLGDLFDGPSDLIVLPCSTSGTITGFVRRRLIHHKIPYPRPAMQLGDLALVPFEGGENIAQYVAFAASVQGNSSSASAIRRIGAQIGNATNERSTIRLVSAPLLGAGSGGLQSEVVVAKLSEGFKETAHRDARLVIHVLHESVFQRLSAGEQSKRNEATRDAAAEAPLRVFISYSHTSLEHEQWVEQLATFLRASGVDARLDVWHLRRGMDLPQFMTNELTLASRVVLVSDEKYAQKADGRVGGVGWETMIVQGDIAQQPPDSNKYLVVVRSTSIDDGLPRYLKTKFVIHWPNETAEERNRQTLLRELYDVIKAPPIGPKPVFL